MHEAVLVIFENVLVKVFGPRKRDVMLTIIPVWEWFGGFRRPQAYFFLLISTFEV